MQKAVSGIILLCFLFALTSCETATSQEPDHRIIFSRDVDEMTQQLAGKTAFFYDSGHGTQVEYFDPDGSAYLWYPGNTRAVRSDWKIQAGGNLASICFKYPSRSYNPVTKQFGGQWECRKSAIFAVFISALVEGDEFDLRSGRIPARMPKATKMNLLDIEALVKRPIEGEILVRVRHF